MMKYFPVRCYKAR